MIVLTPSRTAHDIVQEKREGKDDGAGTKRHQPRRETLDCQEKSGSHPGPDQGNHHCRTGGPNVRSHPCGDRGMARGRPQGHGEQSEKPSEGRGRSIRKPDQGPVGQGRGTRPGG